MRRLTPELKRLAAARPEATRHTAALVGDDDRQAMLAAIMAGEGEITRHGPVATERAEDELARRPPGRKPPQRRALWMATAGAVAAAVTGLLAVLLPGSPVSRGSGLPIETAAFVTRVEHALAEAGRHNMVEYSRTVFPPGFGPKTLAFSRGNVQLASSPWTARSVVRWSYQGNSRMSAFTATGRRVIGLGTATAPGTVTEVSYRTGTWWRATTGPPQPPRPTPARCAPGIQVDPRDWPAFIRHELSCGKLTEGGLQRVNGVDARKLTGDGGREVFWVKPVTYLPVRVILPTSTGAPLQADFGWFTPTKAHLAQVHLSIPPGFRQVSPPGNPSRPR